MRPEDHILLGCQQTFIRFANAIDRFDYDAVVNLYQENAIFINPHGRFEGKDGIRGYLNGRDRGSTSRHMLTNFEIVSSLGDQCEAMCYFTVYRISAKSTNVPLPLNGPDFFGEYFAALRWDGTLWKFRDHRISLLFARS